MEASPLDALRADNSTLSTPLKQRGSVDRESFLNLLVTQLRNQDPLEPVENTEFISQLASFQSLESQLSMGARLEDLVALQESQLALAGLSQAALLVGKHVTWVDGDGKEGAGLIQSVTVENGVMMVNTENGKVPVAFLTSIAIAPPGTGGPVPEPPADPANPVDPADPADADDAEPPVAPPVHSLRPFTTASAAQPGQDS